MSPIQDIIQRVNALASAIGNALQIRGFKVGGATGQVPVKNSNSDYDWSWGNQSQGPAGPQGIQGLQGVQGVQGPQGNPGTNGLNGDDGEDGDSAYEVAVSNGYTGSEADWLLTLVGPPGGEGPPVNTDDLVPYTGAIADLDLGEFNLAAAYGTFLNGFQTERFTDLLDTVVIKCEGGEREFMDSSGSTMAADFANRNLHNDSGIPVILFGDFSSNATLDYFVGTSYYCGGRYFGSGGVAGMSPPDLFDNSEVSSLNWETRQMFDLAGVLSFGWEYRAIFDYLGAQVANWNDTLFNAELGFSCAGLSGLTEDIVIGAVTLNVTGGIITGYE